MLEFKIDAERCVLCDACVEDCPVRIIERTDGLPFIRPEREAHCLRCQHCLAVCPEAALSILGRVPEASLEWGPNHLPRMEQLERLVRGRRSVRRYRDENVDPALIESLIATAAHAPSGVNAQGLVFHVMDDRQQMEQFRRRALADLADGLAADRVPQQFAYLHAAVPAYEKHGVDILMRGAPHFLIVAAPAANPCPHEDIIIALTTFELLAQNAGLGTVWCGMLKMLLETLPDFKAELGLNEGYVYYPMLFGHPAVHYPRTVQRDESVVIRRCEITQQA